MAMSRIKNKYKSNTYIWKAYTYNYFKHISKKKLHW
jgi:hypothetical protein